MPPLAIRAARMPWECWFGIVPWRSRPRCRAPEKHEVGRRAASEVRWSVTTEAAALLRQALDLSPGERADLAAELLASLEPAEDPETIRRLWVQELEKRAREFLAGESPGVDWETARQQVADNLARNKLAR